MAEKKENTAQAPKRKKRKKEKVSPLVKAISIVLSTGKYIIGSRRVLPKVLTGEGKALIIAKGMDKEKRADFLHYAKLSSIPVIEFEGNSLELGITCGKSYPVSVLLVLDEGKSDILKLAKSSKS